MISSSAFVSTPGVILVRAEALTQKGDYAGSIEILESVLQSPEYTHTVSFDASVNLLYARNMLQMNKNLDAWRYLNMIPPDVGIVYPKIDADRRSISGILIRRDAYQTLKDGRVEEALLKANSALIEFGIAEASAIMAHTDGMRLLHNAQLNSLYTKGLILNIKGAEPNKYEPLVVEAVVAEYNSRRKMDDDNRDLITGMTIVADLALGASLTLVEMANLSDDFEYLKAYNAIFGRQGEKSWPQYILNQCFPYRTALSSGQEHMSRVLDLSAMPDLKPETHAKALLLGCKMLLSAKQLDASLLNSYAFELHYCYGLLAKNGTSMGIRQQISDMRRLVPKEVYKRAPNFK